MDRASLLNRIKALSAKTTANGCTEAEAMAAMEKVGQLLRDNGLSMSEIDLKAEADNCKEDFVKIKGKNINNNIGILLSGIAEFCDCEGYTWRHGDSVKDGLFVPAYVRYVFFGMDADVQMASYLMYVCTTAMINDAHKYVKSLGVGQGGARTPRNSFEYGFSMRIYARLKEIKAANRKAIEQSVGTALIVLKDQLVNDQFKEQYKKLGLKDRTVNRRQMDGLHKEAGSQAANKINLQKPLENQGNRLKIS